MASRKGIFRPLNPKKYKGDPTKIVYRSGWERQYMTYLDTHPNILEWASEEKIIGYRDPLTGRPRRYFPDFWIKFKDKDGKIKETLIEVKPFEQTQLPKKTLNKTNKRLIKEQYTYALNQAKWEAAKSYCERKGWGFVVLTERDVNFK
jgi:hypothetical protein